MNDYPTYQTGDQTDNQSKGLSLSLNSPGTLRFVQGEEPVNPKDLEVDNATIAGVVDYVRKRADEIKNRKEECHVQYDVDGARITLFVGEGGPRRDVSGFYLPSAVIEGKAHYSEDYGTVCQIMKGSHRPHDLAMKLRDLPYLFSDAVAYTDVVNTLRNMDIQVNKLVRDTSSDLGAREKGFRTTIESGAADCAWSWQVPIFVGSEPIKIPVTIIYDVDDATAGVLCKVFQPRMRIYEREGAMRIMTQALADITLATDGRIPLIEVAQ